MTPTEREELRRLAEKATKGPWHHHNWDVMEKPHVVADSLGDAADAMGRQFDHCRGQADLPHTYDDAAYIAAANPETMRALLADLDASEEREAVLVKALERIPCNVPGVPEGRCSNYIKNTSQWCEPCKALAAAKAAPHAFREPEKLGVFNPHTVTELRDQIAALTARIAELEKRIEALRAHFDDIEFFKPVSNADDDPYQQIAVFAKHHARKALAADDAASDKEGAR